MPAASAFAARVVTSTRADLHAALTAAVAAFGGTLHGGAAESVAEMLDSVSEPELVVPFVQRRLAAHEPV